MKKIVLLGLCAVFPACGTAPAQTLAEQLEQGLHLVLTRITESAMVEGIAWCELYDVATKTCVQTEAELCDRALQNTLDSMEAWKLARDNECMERGRYGSLSERFEDAAKAGSCMLAADADGRIVGAQWVFHPKKIVQHYCLYVCEDAECHANEREVDPLQNIKAQIARMTPIYIQADRVD